MHIVVSKNFVFAVVLFTVSAFQVCLTSVNLKMLFLVRDLIKLHVARLNWAEERLFTCMDSEVIKKVVPFSKKFSAALVIAREYLRLSTSCSAGVFDESESAGARDVNFVSEAAEVNILPVCKFHRSLFRQLEFLEDSLTYCQAHVRDLFILDIKILSLLEGG